MSVPFVSKLYQESENSPKQWNPKPHLLKSEMKRPCSFPCKSLPQHQWLHWKPWNLNNSQSCLASWKKDESRKKDKVSSPRSQYRILIRAKWVAPTWRIWGARLKIISSLTFFGMCLLRIFSVHPDNRGTADEEFQGSGFQPYIYFLSPWGVTSHKERDILIRMYIITHWHIFGERMT